MISQMIVKSNIIDKVHLLLRDRCLLSCDCMCVLLEAQVCDSVGGGEEVPAPLRDWSEGRWTDRDTVCYRSVGGGSTVGQRVGNHHTAWRSG